MSCFIHSQEEGVAVCKQCGKNMCVNCSSMTGHIGLCPTCYKPVLQNQIFKHKENRKEILETIIQKIILCVLLVWTIFYPLINVFKIIKLFRTRNNLLGEIEECERKIQTIDSALSSGNSNI